MTIEIQVQGGKLTITVGGQAVSDDVDAQVKEEGVVDHTTVPAKTAAVKATSEKAAKKGTPAVGKPAKGGSGSSDKAAIGGSGSSDKAAIGGAGSLSGVVVIGPIVVGCCSAENGNGGADGKLGGSGSSDKAAIGGGGSLSGVTVIGPIVIGTGNGEAAGTDVETDTPRPKAVSIPPTRE